MGLQAVVHNVDSAFISYNISEPTRDFILLFESTPF